MLLLRPLQMLRAPELRLLKQRKTLKSFWEFEAPGFRMMFPKPSKGAESSQNTIAKATQRPEGSCEND